MRTIVIIPARGGSKRLPKKNIYPFNGKPLVGYTIDACKECSFIDSIYVSSDDAEILKVSEELGAIPLVRPTELADDHTPKIVAIRQAALDAKVGTLDRDDIVIVAQANSPQLSSLQLKAGYSNGVQNAAFRMVRFHALFNEFLSAHCGFVVAPNIDVHTLEDLEKI
jgi:CMP-N-acetylneuraminic acid synthetase